MEGSRLTQQLTQIVKVVYDLRPKVKHYGEDLQACVQDLTYKLQLVHSRAQRLICEDSGSSSNNQERRCGRRAKELANYPDGTTYDTNDRGALARHPSDRGALGGVNHSFHGCEML